MTDWLFDSPPIPEPRRCPWHGTPVWKTRGCVTCRIVAKRAVLSRVTPYLLFAAYIVALGVAVYCCSRWPVGAR